MSIQLSDPPLENKIRKAVKQLEYEPTPQQFVRKAVATYIEGLVKNKTIKV